MRSFIGIFLVSWSTGIWAQDSVPTCRDKGSSLQYASSPASMDFSKSSWVVRDIEIELSSFDPYFRVHIKHDFVKNETHVLCFTPAKDLTATINKNWIFPVTSELGETSAFWQLHLVVKSDQSLGYWLQPLRLNSETFSQKIVDQFRYSQITSSVGIAEKLQAQPQFQELIRIRFDK